jgi:hypothetical protein
MLTRQALYLRTHMAEIEGRAEWRIREREARDLMGVATGMTENPNLPRKAELYLLNVRQIYLIHYHRYQECLDITTEWLEKIEQAERPFEYSPDQYKVLLANYLHCALRTDKLDLFPPAIAKIRSLKAHTEKEAADYFRICAQYEMIYVINRREFAGADRMLTEVEAGLKKYQRFIPAAQMVNFRFNIVLLFFFQRKYPDTLSHIGELYVLSGRNESYSYTTGMARAMEWMSEYSMGEYADLDNSLRNLKRYFADRQIKNDFFDSMYELFGRMLKEAGTKPASLPAFRKLISAIIPPPEWEQLRLIILAWI